MSSCGRYAVAGICALLLSLVGGPSARGASFYWYGESPDCWQTGSPTAPGTACDYPGGSSTGNAVTGDLNVPQSGDYCNVYNTPASCANQDAVWPLSFDAALEPCPSVNPLACGVQHYASLNTQRDLPWSVAADGALVLSDELAIKIAKPANTWAYLCALLQAPNEPQAGVRPNYLEFCYDQWQGVYAQANLPEPPFAGRGYGLDVSCAPVTVSGVPSSVDTVVTPFALNQPTPYGTTLPGSANTGVGEGTAMVRFTAQITPENLRKAIQRDNWTTNPERAGSPEYNNSGSKYGCNRGLSENISGYRLVGIEDGTEGRPNSNANATTQNLRAWTEYTPVAATPFVFREPNTGNVDVFYRGADGALWQEGWTPSSGWQAPYRIGGELASDPMGFIEPNETMNIFYRGGNGAIWQYYREPNGHWSTFEVLQGAALSAGKPYGYMQPNGQMNIFYCSTGHVISQLYYNGEWHNPGMAVGEAAPCEGDPTAYLQPSGLQNVFYRTTGGNVGQVWYDATGGTGWHNSPIEVGGNMVGTPTALLEPNGTQNVFYRTTSNMMGQVWYDAPGGTGWHNSPLGGDVISNPDGFMTPNGFQHVFYVNHYGTIGEWWWEPSSGWHDHELGEATQGSPGGLAYPNGAMSVFFFQAGAGILDQWFYNGPWNLSTVGPGTPPQVLPVAETKAASNIAQTTVMLNGSLNPRSGETKYHFEYGTTTAYGTNTVEASAGSGTGAVAESAEVTGLSANTTYHYRVVASNEGGTSYGQDVVFATPEALPQPTVTKIKPTSGPVGGGTSVTITGTNLNGATAVKFGTTNATAFKAVSETTITATAPAEPAGIVDVTVTTPGGTSAAVTADKFHYAPTVTAVTPSTGPTAGGTSVTVTGEGFAVGTTATKFKFGTTAGTSVTCSSSTHCTVVSLAHEAGIVNVKATVNKVTSAATSADEFTYS